MYVGRILENRILGIATRIKGEFSPEAIGRVSTMARSTVDEFISREGKGGQFLNWVDLPKEQIKRVDEIYDMVKALKNQSNAKVLTVLGIGGSKHPVEHMLGVNGLNIKGDKIKFFSDIDSASFNRYLQQLDGNILNSNFLVASKSGSTFETEDGMRRVISRMASELKDTILPKDKIQGEISKHMIAVTDKNPDKSKLRRLSDKDNWLGKLFIHDDVGGRFSAFDDHVLFTLAYAGMNKKDMIEMLKGAQRMSDIAHNRNINQNYPLMQAAFWAMAKLDGIKTSAHQYLGDMFNATVLWHTQMQNESIKDTSKQITKITDAMHHSSEAWYRKDNKSAFALTAPIDLGESKENVNGYIDAISKTNEEFGPSMVELLNTNNLGLAPNTAGAMTQARGFSTVYQEILEKKSNEQPLPDVLDSVLQPNVEEYKKNLKPAVGHEPPVVAGRISK